MRDLIHESCSLRKQIEHAPLSAATIAGVHNSWMPSKDDGKDLIALEMGKRVKDCREAKGWSQKRLAEETGWTVEDADDKSARGLSPSAIGNYEQATRRIGNEEAEILSAALGQPAAYFMAAVSEHEATVLMAMRAPRKSPKGSNRNPG